MAHKQGLFSGLFSDPISEKNSNEAHYDASRPVSDVSSTSLGLGKLKNPESTNNNTTISQNTLYANTDTPLGCETDNHLSIADGYTTPPTLSALRSKYGGAPKQIAMPPWDLSELMTSVAASGVSLAPFGRSGVIVMGGVEKLPVPLRRWLRENQGEVHRALVADGARPVTLADFEGPAPGPRLAPVELPPPPAVAEVTFDVAGATVAAADYRGAPWYSIERPPAREGGWTARCLVCEHEVVIKDFERAPRHCPRCRPVAKLSSGKSERKTGAVQLEFGKGVNS